MTNDELAELDRLLEKAMENPGDVLIKSIYKMTKLAYDFRQKFND